MQQKAADALVGLKRHRLDTIALATITVREADPVVIHLDHAVVGDGHAVRGAPDVIQDVFRTREGRLGIDDPRLTVELVDELRKPFSHRGVLGARISAPGGVPGA